MGHGLGLVSLMLISSEHFFFFLGGEFCSLNWKTKMRQKQTTIAIFCGKEASSAEILYYDLTGLQWNHMFDGLSVPCFPFS